MKFDHRVKVNGKWYNAGEEVDASSPVKTTPKAEKENKVEESTNTYKRSDIQKMKVNELKAFAESNGIEVTDDMSGNDLKKEIFIKLGL